MLNLINMLRSLYLFDTHAARRRMHTCRRFFNPTLGRLLLLRLACPQLPPSRRIRPISRVTPVTPLRNVLRLLRHGVRIDPQTQRYQVILLLIPEGDAHRDIRQDPSLLLPTPCASPPLTPFIVAVVVGRPLTRGTVSRRRARRRQARLQARHAGSALRHRTRGRGRLRRLRR